MLYVTTVWYIYILHMYVICYKVKGFHSIFKIYL